MWWRTVDIGTHQACCPLLQALFITARPADYHRHREDDQYGGFHCDLGTAGPQSLAIPIFRCSK